MQIARRIRLARELDQRVASLWRVALRQTDRELSRTATSVLALMRDRGPQRITALAEAESVAQPTMTTLVGRLERDGYVTRTGDPTDRRATLIALTDEGRDVLARFGNQRAELFEGPLEKLDADDRAALEAALPALDRLIENLKEQS